MIDAPLPLSRKTASPAAVLELLKPVTWFAPCWALACGAVAASGLGNRLDWATVVAGMVLAGPLVCGASQAMNDWCDRHVDAINQPERPIPSGRLPGRSGLAVAIVMSALSLAFAAGLGRYVLAATVVALAAGWAYSAPPLRLKANGWLGPGLTALSYEGLSWLTGALIVGGAAVLSRPWLAGFALLYAIGAHGIMTLNDFKAVAGDRRMGIASLPVVFGERAAARIAVAVMLVPQFVVVAVLGAGGAPVHALGVAALVVGQIALSPPLLRDPAGQAARYAASGVTLYVAGMMVAAFAVRGGLHGMGLFG